MDATRSIDSRYYNNYMEPHQTYKWQSLKMYQDQQKQPRILIYYETFSTSRKLITLCNIYNEENSKKKNYTGNMFTCLSISGHEFSGMVLTIKTDTIRKYCHRYN